LGVATFPAAIDDAVMANGEAHQNQTTQYLNKKAIVAGLRRVTPRPARGGHETAASRERSTAIEPAASAADDS